MSHDFLAVTIGIGEEHARMAQFAADRMRRHTGLPVRVLNVDDLAISGGGDAFDLKFRLFDLLSAENVLFFDADVICLRPWDPRAYCDRPEWIAVRGWYFDPWVTKVGDAYGFGENIFNAGFFLCNRTHHAPLLALAEQLQTEDDTFQGLKNPDEISLNMARAALRTPIDFLDRRYNWIQYGRGNLSSYADVILAHACDKALRPLYAESNPLWERNLPAAVRGTVPSALAGKTFIYDRLGYDLRPMQFRADGTVGEGFGSAELFYFETTNEIGTRLVLGSALDATAQFVLDRDGVWRGRWLHNERMPVTLTLHRAQVLVDLIREAGKADRPLRGAELGVFRGETSRILLRELPQLELTLVDPWRVASAESDYWLTNAGDATMNQQMFDEAMLLTARTTEFAARRRRLVPAPAHKAARLLPGEFDFVFVDGDHSYSGCLQDIEAWWPKLAAGGLMSGHDYANPNFPGVKAAVDDFARQQGLTVRTGSDQVWYYARQS